MSAQRLNKVMMALFFIALGVYLVWGAMARPRVLVVQSDAMDYSWSADVDKAIRRVLKEKPYQVRYHYMDTKSHSDAGFKRIAGARVRKVIDEWQPNALVLVDDNAQSLVGICYVDPAGRDVGELRGVKGGDAQSLFGSCHARHPEMKLVFAGIGAKTEDYGYDHQPNITGIEERMDIPALQESLEIFASRLGGSGLRVVAPIDDSTSGLYNRDSLEVLRERLAPQGIEVRPQVISTFDEWRAMLEEANQSADLLLFSNYHTVKCGTDPSSERVKPERLIAWTNGHSLIPGIGAWGFYVADGGMMSVGVSPFEQGDVAARMVVEILDESKSPQEIPVTTTGQSIIYLREAAVRQAGLRLPRIYEAFALATNNLQKCRDTRGNCAADIEEIERAKASAAPSPCQG